MNSNKIIIYLFVINSIGIVTSLPSSINPIEKNQLKSKQKSEIIIATDNENIPFAEKIVIPNVYAENNIPNIIKQQISNNKPIKNQNYQLNNNYNQEVLSERQEEESNNGKPISTTKFTKTSITINQDNSTIIRGVGCGFTTMKAGDVIEITSSNYGTAPYFHGEACVWRFVGSDCGVSLRCPCFSVPASFKCFGDYLKITDPGIYDQRFCGDVAPQGTYRSVTGHFRLRFRSDYQGTGLGFLCYASCTAPGEADPKLPSNITCFKPTIETSPNIDPCSVVMPGLDQTGPVTIPPRPDNCPTTKDGLIKNNNLNNNNIKNGNNINDKVTNTRPYAEQKQNKIDPSLINYVRNWLDQFFNSGNEGGPVQ